MNVKVKMKKLYMALTITLLVISSAYAGGIKVNLKNYVRAESDYQIQNYANGYTLSVINLFQFL
jgi:hypothetical protein